MAQTGAPTAVQGSHRASSYLKRMIEREKNDKSDFTAELARTYQQEQAKVLSLAMDKETGLGKFQALFPEVTDQRLISFLLALAGPVGFGEHWTEEDEKKLEDAWQVDPVRAEIVEHLNQVNFRHLKQLYYICLRFCRCLPTDIIGPKHNMVYVGSRKRNATRLQGSLLWPPEFCEALSRILLHPFLGAHVPTIVMVLQFTIKVRTDDRRRWTFENPTMDKYIDALIGELAIEASKPHGSTSQEKKGVEEFLRSAELRVSSPNVAPSGYILLFNHIVEAVGEPAGLVLEGRLEDQPYVISLADLEAIESALNRMGLSGLPSAATALMHSVTAFTSTKSNAPGPLRDFSFTRALMLKAGLQAKREKAMIRRAAGRKGRVDRGGDGRGC